MRWALEDKAAQKVETAHGDKWEITNVSANEDMSAHEVYCTNFWKALRQRD